MDDPFSYKTAAREVSRLLNSKALPISDLLTIAGRLNRIEKIIFTHLGPEFKDRVKCAGIRNGELLLLASSGAIANSLKAKSSDIAVLLTEQGIEGVNGIVVRTAAALPI